ncbi:fungal-specific transcription factor domain-containing protein [Trametes meyenii]|nr:fungal-specific transcription factor domain-containing protein [Trametes meyenii]
MPLPDEASSSVPKTRKYKRRKVQKERACDYCRRKKIGDGPLRSDGRCSKCISRNVNCTYIEPFVRHDYSNSYVESLEHRVQKLEKLMQKHCPEIDLAIEEGGSDSEPSLHPVASQPSPADSNPSQIVSSASTPTLLTRTSLLSAMVPPSPARLDDYETSDEDDIAIQDDIVEDLRRLSLNPVARRYHGRSSGLMFMRTAMRLVDNPFPKPWPHSAGTASFGETAHGHSKRDEWVEPLPQAELPPFKDFPPEDLMKDLISIFFTRLNVYTPLLHRPTFTEGLEKKQHLQDGGFGATVLLVCAIGAGFSDDPRVLLDGTDSKSSAGWKWFLQVEAARKSLMAPTRLYDLQICALMAIFLHGTRFTQHIWTLSGLGVRKGLEMGAHRKQTNSSTHTADDELRRRAFWVLVNLDWGFSHAFGRPHIIGDEDMDVPLPIECDDEYWGNGFQQPQGKPSQISYFNCYIRLSRIIAFSTRTIYAIGRSRARFGNGDHLWRQRIVAELDSLLNQWADSVPEHLKWDPQREDELFFRQSACLHAFFYLVQICVHRPFILPDHESPLSFPSLIICTNSARSCIRLLEQTTRRLGTPIAYNMVRTSDLYEIIDI